MRGTLRRLVVWLLSAAILAVGLYLPTCSFYLWDQGSAGQIVTEPLQLRASEREALNICTMLHMAYVTDKKTILTRGKYLTPDSAFNQAKMALESLEEIAFFQLEWDSCTLQDYSIVFCISSEDLSKRMTLWTLTVTTGKGAVMRISLEDRSGMVLGFSYTDPARPLYEAQIPPTQSQILGQELISFFTRYWEVEIGSTTVVSDSGGYLASVSDTGSGMSTEVPYFLDPTGVRINITG